MTIGKDIFDKLTEQAKNSPRLRMNFDLRNSADDQSQRMLNAIEPGSPLPIHRHMQSSESVVCLRGHLRELFYNDNGEITEVIDMMPGGECPALNIPIGQWHTVEVLESGTIIIEMKDGAYAPLGPEDVMEKK
ncbi:MAG: WbuC family cupin fold metalloprotein [Bacteroidaceae bacterium]|nr:WbuC family cupin fold metalloprotein [Bacteroidaceae bacterium]